MPFTIGTGERNGHWCKRWFPLRETYYVIHTLSDRFPILHKGVPKRVIGQLAKEKPAGYDGFRDGTAKRSQGS